MNEDTASALGAIAFAVTVATPTIAFVFDLYPGRLSSRGRAAWYVLLTLTWPLFLVAGAGWCLLRFRWLGSGFVELFRVFFPKKVQLPKATAKEMP